MQKISTEFTDLTTKQSKCLLLHAMGLFASEFAKGKMNQETA